MCIHKDQAHCLARLKLLAAIAVLLVLAVISSKSEDSLTGMDSSRDCIPEPTKQITLAININSEITNPAL